MDINAFLEEHDSTKKYNCTYYHDPYIWKGASLRIKSYLPESNWSKYIKYLNTGGTISDEIRHIPRDCGGLYLFFIQGQTLPFTEQYLAYVGRARYSDSQNLGKRVCEYLGESKKTDGRPKIKRLFKYWKKYLFVRYFPTQDNQLIEAAESMLINSILPPFNSELPQKIIYKSPKKAFL